MHQPASYGGGSPVTVSFHAGSAGAWQVIGQAASAGENLPGAPYIAIDAAATDAAWSLTGFTSNLRYTTRDERTTLDAGSAPLGRAQARMAALIPIRKSPDWWALAQDERRAIYARSAHMMMGLEYLPNIARRLYHSRDLGQAFDFLTWFEFAPQDAGGFDELLARLRRSEEWHYVIREVDIRMIRRG